MNGKWLADTMVSMVVHLWQRHYIRLWSMVSWLQFLCYIFKIQKIYIFLFTPIFLLVFNNNNNFIVLYLYVYYMNALSMNMNMNMFMFRLMLFAVRTRSRYILRRHCRRCRPLISAADVGWPAPSAVVFIKTGLCLKTGPARPGHINFVIRG